MPVRGVNQVKANIRRTFAAISGEKAEAAVDLALIVGGGLADSMTPVDTTNLLNSRFRSVTKSGNKINGKYGYTASYAAAVHRMSGKLKGQPRAHFGKTKSGVEFGGGSLSGSYWAPDGEPQWLTKAFEQSLPEIDRVIQSAMKI